MAEDSLSQHHDIYVVNVLTTIASLLEQQVRCSELELMKEKFIHGSDRETLECRA
jgi:hypothetical protein